MGLAFLQIEQASVLYSDAVELNIEGAREAWRRGSKKDALKIVEDYRQDRAWNTLQLKTRSSICRLEAQLALDNGQISRAKELLTEANCYSPGSALRLEVLILRADDKREEACSLLEGSLDNEVENIALYAALSLEMGKIDKALASLDASVNTSETHRLRALAYLMLGDLKKASEEVSKALLLAPHWTMNRFTSAVIDYYLCLSPPRRMKQLPPWPDPPHWALVRTDDETRSRLSRAAEVFLTLQGEANNHIQFLRALKTWELACVANDSMRRSDANALCAKILSDDPGNEYCLVWAIARRLDVDTSKPRELLEQKARTLDNDCESVISLLMCYMEEQDIVSTKQLILQSRENFERHGQIPIWQFWHDQIEAICSNDNDEVDDPSPKETDFLKLALRARGKKTGNMLPLLQFLEQREAEGDSESIFELCDLYADQGSWAVAVPFAEKLLKIVETAEALRLACTIFFHAGLYSKCAESIEKHRFWFPLSKLPVSLVQMKAAAEQRSGEIRSAVRSAEDALSLASNRVNFCNLAELYLESGDFTALAQLATRHELFPGLTTEDLFVLAARLSSVNHLIGVSLWKRAVGQGVADTQLGGAISIGYSLSLDTELGPLVQRLSALPEGEGLQRIDPLQMQKILQSRYEAATMTYERYRTGEVCLHAAIGVFDDQLSSWYLRRMEENRRDHKKQAPLYVRHGWRSRSEALDAIPKRLCADLSSLLLARRLGVLHHIIANYKPVFIPHGVPLALAAMREATYPHQPKRKDSLIAVQKAINSGLITPFFPGGHSSKSKREQNVERNRELIMVAFASSSSGDGSAYETLSPQSVILRLVELGRLPTDRSTNALLSLGLEGGDEGTGMLETEHEILVECAVLEAFASAGVLHEICETFTVYIEETESTALARAIDEFQKTEEDIIWLTSMIEEIRKGIETGDYRLLPISDDGETDGESISLRCVLDLLRYENENTDLICIDDRAMNGFMHREGTKIVDTVDLLVHLKSIGQLDSNDFYRYLHRYRASGLRFLALSKDELLYWLNLAVAKHGQFRESYELLIIRLNHARAVVDANVLRTAPVAEGQTLEWPFLLDSAGGVLDALQEVWSRGKGDSCCEMKAEWLLSHLYVPDRGRSSAINSVTPESDLMMEASTLGSLIATTFAGFAPDDKGCGKRRAYINWLYHRLLLPRFESDNELRELTLQQLMQNLRILHPQQGQSKEEIAARTEITRLWIEDLPEEIRSRVMADRSLMDGFGVTKVTALIIGDMHFNAMQFWSAAREVIREGSPVSLGGGRLFSRKGNEFSWLAVENIRTNEVSLLEGIPLEILASSESQREEALLYVVSEFDLPQRDAARLRQSLCEENLQSECMQELISLPAKSSRHFFSFLNKALREGKQVSLSDFIPNDIHFFLRYLHIEIENNGSGRMEAQQDILSHLATSLPLDDALDRLGQIPSTFPPEILERLNRLSVQERREILKWFLKRSEWNIVHLSHACNLFYTFHSDNPAYTRLAEKLLRRIRVAKGTPPVDALLRILQQVESELRLNTNFAKLPIVIRLLSLWSHSSNLLRVMANANLDLDWIGRNFGRGWNRLPTEIFQDEAEYWRDVAHPSRLFPSRFVLALTWFASQRGVHLSQEIRQEISEVWKNDGLGVMELLFNASREPDAMASFFAESTGWPAALVGEVYEYYTSSRDPLGATEAAKILRQGGDLIHWAHLQAVLRNGTVPDDAREEFRELLISADFGEIWSARSNLISAALSFASMHAQTLGADIVDKVRSDILMLAKKDFNEQESRHESNIKSLLLSAAFYLYRRSAPQEKQFEHTAELWRELVECNPTLVSACQLMVDRFIEALPNRHARHLWKLQVYLRSCNMLPERHEELAGAIESDQETRGTN